MRRLENSITAWVVGGGGGGARALWPGRAAPGRPGEAPAPARPTPQHRPPRGLRPHVRELAPLAGGCLHVWRVDLAAAGEGLLRLVSVEERERAARIISARRARLWAHARGVLRALLGGYLASDPSAVTLA